MPGWVIPARIAGPSGDLSKRKVSLILAAGLALMPAQHVDSSGWKPASTPGRAAIGLQVDPPDLPDLPMTSRIRAVFGKVLGLVPSGPGEDLASELAAVLGAPPDAGGGAITPGDLSSVASVLAAWLDRATPGSPLHHRLSALEAFYSAQARAPTALPRIAVVSAAMSHIGAVSADVPDPANPELRTGAAALLEFFTAAFGEARRVNPAAVTRWSPRPDALPSWCGIFALWATKAGGVQVGDWKAGSGLGSVPGFMILPRGEAPLPGDVGYKTSYQHTFVVVSIAGAGPDATVTCVSGNMGPGGVIQVESRPLRSITGFLRATALSAPAPAAAAAPASR